MEPSPFSTDEDVTASKQSALFEEPANESNVLPSSNADDQAGLLTTTCSFCGRPVDPKHESTYAEIRTWVHGAKKDSSVLRQYTGLYADSGCIAMLRAGHHPMQKTLEETINEDPVSDRVTNSLATDRSPDFLKGFSLGVAGARHDNLDSESFDFQDGYEEGHSAFIMKMSSTHLPPNEPA